MSEGEKKRKSIFEAYSNHLTLLVKNGILNVELNFPKTYICPICLVQFSESALDQSIENPLTLEDVPPKALGGRANILTCKRCNNKCGVQVDHHLIKRIIEVDNSKFLPGTKFNLNFKLKGKIVQGGVNVDQKGEITVNHKTKQNHPKTLANYIKSAMPNVIINLIFRNQQIDTNKLQLALLKIGYLLTFEKFGYSFLLDNSYDRIRYQLLNPAEFGYPNDFWFRPPYPKEIFGVHFITEPGLEALLAIFPLKTSVNESVFATIIPLSIHSIEKVITEREKRTAQTGSFSLRMDAVGNNTDCLTDIATILKLLKWIKEKTIVN